MMNPFLSAIGTMLIKERKARKLTQIDACHAAGISRREIYQIEKGIFTGSIIKVQNYAMSLGFSLTLEIKRRPTLDELDGLFDEN